MDLALDATGWTRRDGVAVRGRAFAESNLLAGPDLAARFADVRECGEPLAATAAVAAGLEGFYAAVVRNGPRTLLVADGARSIPLYYDAGGRLVADRGRRVRDAIDADRDSVAESEFLLTRYVTGPETIWDGVFATRPGEVVAVGADGVRRRTYREHWPAGGGSSETDPRRRLRAGLETALDRLEGVAGDRPIVVPLSGGYDSRLLAAALVDRGREVIAFTFGRSGHPDVEVSREVAARLGIRWEFYAYDEAAWREWYHGDACRGYRERAFGGDALAFLAEWPALHGLLESGRLPRDALYCPGHTVATPGERLPRFVGEDADGAVDPTVRRPAGSTVGCAPVAGTEAGANGGPTISPTVDGLVEYVLDAHYDLWECDDRAFLSAARERIRRGLLGGRESSAVTGPETAAAAYERWEWRGRMTTFTNGDLRVYEDAGVDWWLPLWDPAYVRAWAAVPLTRRRGKVAHADLAVERYRHVANVPAGRAGLTDRTLSAPDRHCSLVRHTPVRQFTERDGRWDPPFLAPRSAWTEPGRHPLAWDGAVADDLLDRLPDGVDFYALRTLAETGRLDLSDPQATPPTDGLSLSRS